MTGPDLSRSPSRRRRNEELPQRVQAEVEKEELCQLNIDVPVALHRALRRRALDDDISLRVLCIRALEAALEK